MKSDDEIGTSRGLTDDEIKYRLRKRGYRIVAEPEEEPKWKQRDFLPSGWKRKPKRIGRV